MIRIHTETHTHTHTCEEDSIRPDERSNMMLICGDKTMLWNIILALIIIIITITAR